MATRSNLLFDLSEILLRRFDRTLRGGYSALEYVCVHILVSMYSGF